MKGYLLDTHILIWLLNEDTNLNKNIREDIEYYQHAYYVSVESLREVVILQSLKRITFNFSLNAIITGLNEHQIQVVSTEIGHIKGLKELPLLRINGKTHDDPFDRLLIAQSIVNDYTLISSDMKFPFYRDYGLKLLINER